MFFVVQGNPFPDMLDSEASTNVIIYLFLSSYILYDRDELKTISSDFCFDTMDTFIYVYVCILQTMKLLELIFSVFLDPEFFEM